MARHPNTGEIVWFNHLTFFHRLSLDANPRELIDEMCGDAGRAHATYYGDGSLIEDEFIEHLQDCYNAEKAAFDWKSGDVLLLDNMLASHGRRPFKGARKIAVVMSGLRSWSEVALGT